MDGWVGGWDQEPAGWQEWPLPDFFFSIPPPPTDRPLSPCLGQADGNINDQTGVVVVWVGTQCLDTVCGVHSPWSVVDEESRRCRGRGSRYAHSNSGPGLHGAHHPGGQVPSGPRYLGRYGVPRWAPPFSVQCSPATPSVPGCSAASGRPPALSTEHIHHLAKGSGMARPKVPGYSWR